MIEDASALVWMLPVLCLTIWFQRAASFFVPVKHLQNPLLQSLNRMAPMAIIAVLVLISLNTGIMDGWIGVAIEVAILSVLGVIYLVTNQVLLTVVLAALSHWVFGCWSKLPMVSDSCQVLGSLLLQLDKIRF